MTYADLERRRATRRAYYAANLEKMRERARARKQGYGRACIGCGERTDGSNGRDKAPHYCVRCFNEGRAVWTKASCIAAIQLYAIRYGRPPAAVDFNPALARAQGRDDWAETFLADGDYPQTNIVQYVFGSWNAAIAAAGFEPRGIGKRGPDRPRDAA